MAIVVRAGQIREGTHEFKPMPQLKATGDVYEHQYPKRLQDFPLDEKFSHEQLEPSPLSPFQHQLRYDAESVFWLFVWWSSQIRPAESKSEDLLPTVYCTLLTAGMDCRERFIHPSFPAGILHADYQPLEVLLKQMATHLKGDHSLDPSRQHPEYLHNALYLNSYSQTMIRSSWSSKYTMNSAR
jgi:hypothetical protein